MRPLLGNAAKRKPASALIQQVAEEKARKEAAKAEKKAAREAERARKKKSKKGGKEEEEKEEITRVWNKQLVRQKSVASPKLVCQNELYRRTLFANCRQRYQDYKLFHDHEW